MSHEARFLLPAPLGVLHARWGPRGLNRVGCTAGPDPANGGGVPLPQRLLPEGSRRGPFHPPTAPAARAGGTLGARLGDALARYLAGEPESFDLPLDPVGTPFQEKVWAALRTIPHGTVTTYGALAERLGSHPRAVGQAVGQNPLWILVPCHRVVGSDGRLTGYAGGLERKEALLRLEGVLR